MTTPRISASIQAVYRDFHGGEHGGGAQRSELDALDKAANIQRLCARVPHDSVLEIGAGDGAVLERLSAGCFGNRYAAVEISEPGIEHLRAKQIAGLSDAKLFNGSTLPYEDKLEHPRQLIDEAARVAQHVFIEVPLEHTMRMTPDFKMDWIGHINFFAPKTIRRLVQSCGLTIDEQIIVTSSAAIYREDNPRTWWLRYAMKRGALAILPALATGVFTYHSALLAH